MKITHNGNLMALRQGQSCREFSVLLNGKNAISVKGVVFLLKITKENNLIFFKLWQRKCWWQTASSLNVSLLLKNRESAEITKINCERNMLR